MKIILTENQLHQILNITETESTVHFDERVIGRLAKLNLSGKEVAVINGNLAFIKTIDFPEDEDYAIKIHNLQITPRNEEVFIYDIHKGRKYPAYKVTEDNGDISIGNELWVVIRANTAVTFMLAKSYAIYNPKKMFYVDNILDMKSLTHEIKIGKLTFVKNES